MRAPLRFDAEPDTSDTGLRFTDVLFGFVIRELFIRLEDWQRLPWYVRAHLLAGSVLVLGSYVGYRNSLKRGNFKLRFVNLPLLRFVADQFMIVIYFRFAVATPNLSQASPRFPGPAELTRIDVNLVMLIFTLYLLWDLLSLAMARVDRGGKYGREKRGVDGRIYPGVVFTPSGLIITLVFGAVAAVGRFWSDNSLLHAGTATAVLVATAAWLFLYRTAKDFGSRLRVEPSDQ